MGRLLRNALLSLDIEDETVEALNASAYLEDVYEGEKDAGLGNGGLGRLAACFLDSCATLALPVVGYGIRYQYGMFHQRIENGHQVEYPDPWLREGFPGRSNASSTRRRCTSAAAATATPRKA